MMGNISREQLGEWLSAYLDGEVGEEQRALIEQLLREDGAARETYEELRRTVEMVGSLPRHRAPESIVEDIQAYAERSELIGDVAAGGFDAVRRRSPLVPLLSTAAALVLTAAGVWYVADLANTPTPTAPTAAVATREVDAEESTAGRSRRREAGAKPSPPAIPASFLASATFEQKLAGGLGVEAVRKHTFENETVRLEVTVGSDVERDLMTARLIGQLKKQTAQDLSRRDDTGEHPAGRFYFEGTPKVNFAEPGQRQVLVRAPRHDVEALMEEMSKATSASKEFALTAGPLSVRGFGRARAMITGLEENIQVAGQVNASPPAGDAGDPAVVFYGGAEFAAAKDAGATTNFDKLLSAVGLSQEAVRRTFAQPPAAVTNEPLTLAPPAVVSDEDASDLAGPPPPSFAIGQLDMEATPSETESSVAMSSAVREDRLAVADVDVERKSKDEGTESLVSRRMRAIDKARLKKTTPEVASRGQPATEAASEAGAPSPPSDGRGGATASETSPDGYVTLVIQVKIEDANAAEPRPKPAGRSTKPAKEATHQ